MHRWTAPVVALALLALAGCAASAPPTDSAPEALLEVAPGWSEPGWMAQVRQEDETFQRGQIACYAEYGLTATATMGGSVGFVNLPTDAATEKLLDDAAADCNARVPLPERKSLHALDDAAYARMIEVRACIVAHGWELPEPPSAQTWKDASLEEAWNPYQVLIGPGAQKIAAAELFALADACPQPGPNYVVLAPTDPTS